MKAKDRNYERIVQAIYQQILSQSGLAETIEVLHDVKVAGLTTTHQIDVYWEFELGGVHHRVLVQAKNWRRRVSKGALLTLKAVRDDIPGSSAVIVTAKGYQRGALEVASGYGIGICLLQRDVEKLPIKIQVGDSFKLEVKGFVRSQQFPVGFLMAATLPTVEFSNWNIQVDLESAQKLNRPEPLPSKIEAGFEGLDLVDEDGKALALNTYLAAIKQSVCQGFLNEGISEGTYTLKFDRTHHIRGEWFGEGVIFRALTVDYIVTAQTKEWEAPFKNVALYIMENVADGKRTKFAIRSN